MAACFDELGFRARYIHTYNSSSTGACQRAVVLVRLGGRAAAGASSPTTLTPRCKSYSGRAASADTSTSRLAVRKFVNWKFHTHDRILDGMEVSWQDAAGAREACAALRHAHATRRWISQTQWRVSDSPYRASSLRLRVRRTWAPRFWVVGALWHRW
ncbi:hypothetical protein BC834DRAFT_589721 [Gloeopeniophorella convolvens]|nr:hypothetical protein BC834DRAFT_589721 [Gloeopeniophorella convolvens]